MTFNKYFLATGKTCIVFPKAPEESFIIYSLI